MQHNSIIYKNRANEEHTAEAYNALNLELTNKIALSLELECKLLDIRYKL